MAENKEEKSPCCMRISALNEAGYVEIVGPGTMNIAPILRDVCYAMINEEKSMIFVNLKDCEYIDSTFMGTLVNIQERFSKKGIDKGRLYLFNMGEANLKLLKMVGIDTIVQTLPDEIEVPDFKMKAIDDCDIDREEKLRVVVEAHEKLVQLNELNREKFESFINVVKKEMKEDGIK